MKTTTYILAVFGNPIAHSLSPRIHRAFAEQCHIHLTYEKILIPIESFEQKVLEFFSRGGKGLNITSPFKERAFKMAGILGKSAAIAQSVNTLLLNENNQLVGESTDGIGFIRDLTQNLNVSIREKNILLLGAGGAARAILFPLLHKKPKSIWIANRTETKAQELANHFHNYGPVHPCSWHAIPEMPFDIIINSTTTGSHSPPMDFELTNAHLSPATVCYDLTYSRLAPFQQWVKNIGAQKIYNGIGMLVEQAAESFYLWFNVKPNVQEILTLLKSE